MGIVANVKKRNRTRVELNALTIRLRTSRPERKEPHGEGTTDEDEDDEVKWKRCSDRKVVGGEGTQNTSRFQAGSREEEKEDGFSSSLADLQPRFTQLVACYR